MSEPETVKDAEFAFLVVKQKDGRFAVANVNNDNTERQPSLEEVHQALAALQQDLDRQTLAMLIVNAITQTQSNKTTSGIVVPPEKKFVRRS